ncbi:MAG: hypothetical protein KJ065_16565 [Anaerolineae bacterium]|nr:hypothetical protein [Anaerolineae bacterium]
MNVQQGLNQALSLQTLTQFSPNIRHADATAKLRNPTRFPHRVLPVTKL